MGGFAVSVLTRKTLFVPKAQHPHRASCSFCFAEVARTERLQRRHISLAFASALVRGVARLIAD